MANSAKTLTQAKYNEQPGVLGHLRSIQTKVNFGADYAAAVLPRITARELGLAEIAVVIANGAASTGASVDPQIAADRSYVELKLWNGTTAIGTTDQNATTANLTILGH